MKVRLIPVLDISNEGKDIKAPQNSPAWEFQNEWADYFKAANRQAGFSDNLTPYLNWYTFYKLDSLSDRDLLTLVNRALDESRDENGEIDMEALCSFEGGFILNIDGRDLLFPQCCSRLAYIEEFQRVVANDVEFFYHGHPAPIVTIESGIVRFDTTKDSFAPPTQGIIELSIEAL
ncbi:MAG: hypothetical protein LBQ52_01430, partial [Helicobacteraceae bacterium]|nr:hypothetical protein [Helicobacteraceae bacterium]